MEIGDGIVVVLLALMYLEVGRAWNNTNPA